MDLYCPKCTEPWDIDSLHDAVAERHDPSEWHDKNGKYLDAEYVKLFEGVRKEFRNTGCAVFGDRCNPETLRRNVNNPIGEIMDLLGDDIDGAASILDDARQMGLF